MLSLFKLCLDWRKPSHMSPSLYDQYSYELLCVRLKETIYVKYSDVRKFADLTQLYKYGNNYSSITIKDLLPLTTAAPYIGKKDMATRIVTAECAVRFLATIDVNKSEMIKAALVESKPIAYAITLAEVRPTIKVQSDEEDAPLKTVLQIMDQHQEIHKMSFQPMKLEEEKAPIVCLNQDSMIPTSFQINFENGQCIKYFKK